MMTPIVSHQNRTQIRFFFAAVLLALLAMLLPACAAQIEEEPATETGSTSGAAGEEIELYKRFSSAQNGEMEHFVGAIDDALFIGIAVSPEASPDEEPRALAVYLCDGDTVSRWIVEEITGQEATLIADDTSVELSIAHDSVTGTVALDDGASRSFTAGLATGNAGLYRAEWNLAGIDYQIDWIVLADGRQRGGLDGKGNDVYPPPRIVN